MTRIFYNVSLALIIIGAINWGLIGFNKFNLVESLFGTDNILTRIIYILVGMSGLCIIAVKSVELSRNDQNINN